MARDEEIHRLYGSRISLLRKLFYGEFLCDPIFGGSNSVVMRRVVFGSRTDVLLLPPYSCVMK